MAGLVYSDLYVEINHFMLGIRRATIPGSGAALFSPGGLDQLK